MPHRRPVQVTTTTHACVLAWYALLTVLGVLHVTNQASHMGMTALVGEAWTALWAMLTVCAGITALVGAVGSRLMANPSSTLWIEAIGVLGLAVTSTVYVLSLWQSQGAGSVLATQVPQWAVILGGIARIAQIGVETRRIRQAVADPAPASPSPLAVADDDH